MKLVAILRVKNEIPMIAACLAKLSELTDEIMIVDNGSTDGTLAVYPSFEKVVTVLKTEGYHEGRDKCLLLEKAKERNPDWLMCIDGDEVFETACTRRDMERYMRSRYDCVRFRLCTFWQNEERFRIDGKFLLYALEPQRSMWRNIPQAYFSDKKMHLGDIRGIRGATYVSPFRIRHYGYPTREKIEQKRRVYEAEDQDNIRTYGHIRADAPTRLFTFRAYDNPLLHHTYLMAYKYAANTILFFIQAQRKYRQYFYGHL